MAEKDKTDVSVFEIIEKALKQRYGGQEMTRFKEYSAGYDPETPSGKPEGSAAVEPAGTKKFF